MPLYVNLTSRRKNHSACWGCMQHLPGMSLETKEKSEIEISSMFNVVVVGCIVQNRSSLLRWRLYLWGRSHVLMPLYVNLTSRRKNHSACWGCMQHLPGKCSMLLLLGASFRIDHLCSVEGCTSSTYLCFLIWFHFFPLRSFSRPDALVC
jgi:hypothetical protein